MIPTWSLLIPKPVQSPFPSSLDYVGIDAMANLNCPAILIGLLAPPLVIPR